MIIIYKSKRKSLTIIWCVFFVIGFVTASMEISSNQRKKKSVSKLGLKLRMGLRNDDNNKNTTYNQSEEINKESSLTRRQNEQRRTMTITPVAINPTILPISRKSSFDREKNDDFNPTASRRRDSYLDALDYSHALTFVKNSQDYVSNFKDQTSIGPVYRNSSTQNNNNKNHPLPSKFFKNVIFNFFCM